MKILVVDERPQRQENVLRESGMLELFESMRKTKNLTNSTNLEEGKLLDYDLYAIHRSYLASNNMLDKVKKELQQNNKHLILFSGGTDTSSISNYGMVVDMSSKTFYSERILSFLKENVENSDMEYFFYKMLYGNDWKTTFLLKLRYLLWKYGVKDIDAILPESADEERTLDELTDIFGDTIDIEEVEKRIKEL